MKTASIIFLLVVVTCIQTPLGQVLKLPLLIEHFIKHKKQDGVSLLSFLQDHYRSGHNDADLPEDEKLPFKNMSFHSVGYAILPNVDKEKIFVPLNMRTKVFLIDFYTAQQYLAAVFHPPRLSSP